MIQELTNQEKARVFAMYLGCDVNLMGMWEENSDDPKIPIIYKLNGVVKEGSSGTIFCHFDTDEWHEEFIISDVFLLLTPLSEITDEDAIEVARMCWLGGIGRTTDFKVFKRDNFAVWIEGYDKIGINHYICFNKYSGIASQSIFPESRNEKAKTLDHNIGSVQSDCHDGTPYIMIVQYLISKGYAVPLFFGVNHPLNGKTAIELGIAIKK